MGNIAVGWTLEIELLILFVIVIIFIIVFWFFIWVLNDYWGGDNPYKTTVWIRTFLIKELNIRNIKLYNRIESKVSSLCTLWIRLTKSTFFLLLLFPILFILANWRFWKCINKLVDFMWFQINEWSSLGWSLLWTTQNSIAKLQSYVLLILTHVVVGLICFGVQTIFICSV